MKNILLTIFLLASVEIFAGGGWPIGKKKTYVKLGQNAIVSPFYYSPSGDIVDIRTTSLYTTSLYAEYGLSDRLTAILYLPFFVRATLNEVQYRQSGRVDEGEMLNAIGDTDISFKYSLIKDKPIVVSTTVLLGLPLGETRGGASGILQSGDGEFNQMLRVDGSHSFYPKPLYASAYIGVNNRTKNFSDDFRAGAEVGYTFKNKLVTILKFDLVQSFFNGSTLVADNGIFSNNTEYVSPSVEFAYVVNNNWGVSASAGFALAGRNILAAPNVGLGIFVKK
jgi:protein XagA